LILTEFLQKNTGGQWVFPAPGVDVGGVGGVSSLLACYISVIEDDDTDYRVYRLRVDSGFSPHPVLMLEESEG
jgi:hypothetical protein